MKGKRKEDGRKEKKERRMRVRKRKEGKKDSEKINN